jgi:hypothetical protein
MGYMIRFVRRVLVLLLGVAFFSCQNDDFRIGSNLVDPQTVVYYTDTLSVKISGVVIDSVATSGSNVPVVYAGEYYDPEIGRVSARSYFEFSRSADSETNRYAAFDSVALILNSTGSYYGDTLLNPAIKVHRLAEKIDYGDQGALYSTSRPLSLGDLLLDTTFKMIVGAKPEIELKLPDVFGQELFDGIRFNDLEMNADNFPETFPGLSISAGTGSNCVYGFAMAGDTSAIIRIYYHISTTYKEEKTMEFKVNYGKKFYRMEYAKLPYLQFTSKDDPAPSSGAGNMGFIMSGGAPMYARLEFPYLNNFEPLAEILSIQNATLIIRPIRHSYDTVPLPPTLNLYYHDPTNQNQFGSALIERTASNQQQVMTGNLESNYPNYKFNITDFVSTQIGKYNYNKWALNLAIPESAQGSTLQRLVFGDRNYWYQTEGNSRDNRIQLVVTYALYNEFEY